MSEGAPIMIDHQRGDKSLSWLKLSPSCSGAAIKMEGPHGESSELAMSALPDGADRELVPV